MTAQQVTSSVDVVSKIAKEWGAHTAVLIAALWWMHGQNEEFRAQDKVYREAQGKDLNELKANVHEYELYIRGTLSELVEKNVESNREVARALEESAESYSDVATAIEKLRESVSNGDH